MKHLIILLFPILIFSQDNIMAEVLFDGRLTFLGDDHGNKAGTLDVKLGFELQGRQLDQHFFSMKAQYEFADLSGGKYVSYLISGGWVLNQLIVRNTEIGLFITTGLIHRFGTSFFTYGLTGELSYRLNDRWSLTNQLQAIDRGDLRHQWGKGKMGISYYLGIKYKLK